MARILVVHGESGPRSFMEERAKRHHEVHSVRSVDAAIRAIPKFRPELMIAHLSAKNPEGLALLRHLRRNGTSAPVLMVGEPSAAVLWPVARKLRAAAFLEYPMEQETLDRAVAKALQADKDAHNTIPDICDEELDGNISQMQTALNSKMVCFAGKNQVYIQSIILGEGRTTKPRLALKCSLRRKFGIKPDVYYEYIRDVCCNDPSSCPAYQEFQSRHSV